MTSDTHPDSAIQLVDALCHIRSFNEGAFEADIASYIADYLKTHCPWLTVILEETAQSRPNVIAYDSTLADTRLLIVGHTDTVPPSPTDQWTVPEFSINNGRYYALGAADAKGGIAAVLDGIVKAGPTSGVTYLFYTDEEYAFGGMKHFVSNHPEVQPDLILSACGASAEMTAGCRGCIEFSYTLRGRSGHASRPHLSESAIDAMHVVNQRLISWCSQRTKPYKTSINIAAIHAGLLRNTIPPLPTSDSDVNPEKLIPDMRHAANNVPDVAWALVDVRPGDADVTPAALEQCITDSIDKYNTENDKHIELAQFFVRFHVDGYHSPEGSFDAIQRHFATVHNGAISNPSERGYIDVAMISSQLPNAGCVCMAPLKANDHSPDEWVDVASLMDYRDGIVRLLNDYPA